MLTIHIENELENRLLTLAKREQLTPVLLIQKLLNQYDTQAETEDFFSTAGLWQDYDITQENLRKQAWRK
jgi:hypothetical protein